MPDVTVELRNVQETGAAMGWAGGHTLVVDRPDGKAGGQGLGFNGAQLLALAIGGCFCNDLRYAAAELGVDLSDIAVTVALELAGSPLVATSAVMSVRCSAADGADVSAVMARASQVCTVANSVRQGFPVRIDTR